MNINQLPLLPVAPGPRLYLSNFASKKTTGCHGPGPLLTIMAKPRTEFGEWGEGRVEALAPPRFLLVKVKGHTLGFANYATQLEDIFTRRGPLGPSALAYEAIGQPSPPLIMVPDGATLACCCALGAPCHRLVAARVLLAAGWRITLDGVDTDTDAIDARLCAEGVS